MDDAIHFAGPVARNPGEVEGEGVAAPGGEEVPRVAVGVITRSRPLAIQEDTSLEGIMIVYAGPASIRKGISAIILTEEAAFADMNAMEVGEVEGEAKMMKI